MTQIFAHRGDSGNFPENTLAAFKAALRSGADGIETDIHLTKDGQMVIIHDETLERTTDGYGKVMEHDLYQLRQLNAAAKFKKRKVHARLPVLQEVIYLLIRENFHGILNIEIKTDVIAYEGIEAKLANYISGTSLPFELIFSSFNLASLEKMHELLPEAKLAYIFREETKKAEQVEHSEFLEASHPKITWIREHKYRLDKYQKPIRVWTVNDSADMRLCFEQKVSGIFTNHPELALKIRQEEFDG